MPSGHSAPPRIRASKSCGNCRAIKRRCDLQIPHCGQCIRQREQCPGYRDQWDLVFRDQTDHTIKRSKQKRAQRAAATGSSLPLTPSHPQHAAPPPPARGPNPGVDEIGVNYFLHHFVMSDDSPSRGFLNYIPVVYTAEAEHCTLVASMAAVGLLALANSTRQPDLVGHARVKYSEAIRNVNAALASPTESVKDSTLMSVISLGVFEHASNFESWVRHVRGAAALIVARGKNQFARKASIFMFNQVRADLVVACLHSNQPFPDDMYKLQEAAAPFVESSRTFWLMGVVASRCANLTYAVIRNAGEIPYSDLLEQATVLQAEFQSVFAVLAVQEPYITTLEPDRDPEFFHNGRYDLYKHTYAIRVWNNSRCMQMIHCEVMCYLLQKALATDLPPAIRESLSLRLQETLKIQLKLGEDILATVPQTLGLVSLEPTPQTPLNFSSDANVSGGYLLIWCLYLVGRSPVTTSKSRKWIIRRLQAIGEVAGTKMALQLLADIVKMDQSAG
ncbi:hypothetical protein BO70DRAFT_336407 [Aspergillus heteromorphus CBS 117.55]|uniref:Zn(2)-C6 fungal-type domain-containing protein n=1 Tax=Aspergillus heteromorphus CBS 117.55 TaxID=1448321 RepID=A0A317W7K0_9EURO|nr:uncharacterized protein BO70DRAFT_336407 [Aspergillus heteromorphus CBS 117.55]PWY82059.1 hypothetical protein BO70DRAFT_336407 [Aspergillus heteromorphus CBS 117.55]